MATEAFNVVLSARISERMNEKILAEQERFLKTTGIKPSINDVVRMLLDRGLAASQPRHTPLAGRSRR